MINAINKCRASANSSSQSEMGKKCRKPEPNICEHVDNHHKVVMIRCWPNRNVTNTQRWRVLIMMWTPCICVRSCLQKIVSGALLSSMFSLNWKIQHTEYWYTKTTNILYLDIWPTRKNWILLFCYTLIFLQRFLYIDLT